MVLYVHRVQPTIHCRGTRTDLRARGQWGPLMLIVFPCALTLLTFGMLWNAETTVTRTLMSTPSLRPVLALVLIDQ